MQRDRGLVNQKVKSAMVSNREANIKIVAARLQRRIDAGEVTKKMVREDLEMLLRLIREEDKA